jgi:glucan 1,3-beta-glucosidase
MRSFFPTALFLASYIISNAQALGSSCKGTLGSGTAAASDPYWMQDIAHKGTSAFNPDPPSYKTFRNVKDYGAKGDGVTDDTAAINAAISDQDRCGQGCNSSTVTPALVYFPSGGCRASSNSVYVQRP